MEDIRELHVVSSGSVPGREEFQSIQEACSKAALYRKEKPVTF